MVLKQELGYGRITLFTGQSMSVCSAITAVGSDQNKNKVIGLGGGNEVENVWESLRRWKNLWQGIDKPEVTFPSLLPLQPPVKDK